MNTVQRFKQRKIQKAQLGTLLKKGWDRLSNAVQVAAIAESPAVMTASGWTIDSRTGKAKQDSFNTPKRNKLADNLATIGEAGVTAPTLVGDIGALATAVRHPVQTIKAINKGVQNVGQYVKKINKVNKEINKGIKENSILESYNQVEANKDIGTAYDYLDFLDNIYPNSKLNATFYHGGPKGIQKFKSAKQLGKTNKGINSATKDHGIYLADDKSLAQYYAGTNKKGNRHLYNVRVNVQNPMRYETNNWYLDKMSTTGNFRFRPGEITQKWYDRLNLKNYDGIYHTKSKNVFDNGELVMFDGNNIHIMGTPEESQMFRTWKQNPQYSSKPLQEEIPITPQQYDKTLKNYIDVAKPGIFLGGLAATPVGLAIYQNYQNNKRKQNNLSNKKIK